MPNRWKGPVISDDDILLERRDILKVEVVETHTSRFTNTIVTKITQYATNTASHVHGLVTDSIVKGAMADDNGEVMAFAHDNMAPTYSSRRPRHDRHRIPMLSFRSHLAIFILVFSSVLAVACSYLRK
ncbi:hypothetical protein E5D57_013172 [Metarhizium anisopliae]|nr:hypothetical protein E5D57_013172 [Metarhizium anisopliae]